MIKKIHWKGDFSNAPKSGTANIIGEMAHITWEDGTKTLAPLFTMLARYGWTIND